MRKPATLILLLLLTACAALPVVETAIDVYSAWANAYIQGARGETAPTCSTGVAASACARVDTILAQASTILSGIQAVTGTVEAVRAKQDELNAKLVELNKPAAEIDAAKIQAAR